MAALFLGAALGASSLTMAPAAQAAPAHHASVAVAAKATTPTTVVKRLSLASGPVAGGNKVLIQGTNLATAAVAPATGWVAKEVRFGVLKKDDFTGEVVPSGDVTALSKDVLQVEVPAGSEELLSVTVLVGDAVKGPKYTYVSSAPVVTSDQEDLDEFEPTAEAGLLSTDEAPVKIVGSGFSAKGTSVLVGGKKARSALNEGKTEIVFSFPAGLVGPQDVVVSDKRGSTYVGYVTYTAIQPDLDEEQDGVEYALTTVATAVTVSGTNVNQLSTGTFDTGAEKLEKVTVKAVKDSTTKAIVTIPKGAAASGTVTLSTKFGKTVEFDVERKAAVLPTVTAIAANDGVDVLKGGVYTLTGTDLIGLKAVTLEYTADGATKVIKGSTFVVSSSTRATVKLPKLLDDKTYTLKVTTQHATTVTLAVEVADGEIVADDGAEEPVVVTLDSADYEPVSRVLTVAGDNAETATKVRYYVTADGVGTAVEADLTPGMAGIASTTLDVADALAEGDYTVQVSVNGTDWIGSASMTVGP